VAVYRVAGNRRGLVQALLNSAGLRSEGGELLAARRTSEETLPVFREIGDKAGEIAALNNLASLLLQMGELRAARARAEQALTLARTTNQRSGVAQALQNLGEGSRLAGDLPAARTAYEQVLQMGLEVDEPDVVAATRLRLARLLLEEGQAASAVTAAQAVLTGPRALRVDRRAEGSALLVQALLASGREAEARVQVLRSSEAAAGRGRAARQNLALAAAEVEARVGDRATGLARLQAVLDEARKNSQIDLQFDVRRVRVGLGVERGQDLARDARARGFDLYVRPLVIQSPKAAARAVP
jgi:tetratricopeptide (TPR) repeat protein